MDRLSRGRVCCSYNLMNIKTSLYFGLVFLWKDFYPRVVIVLFFVVILVEIVYN